jgi:hypothetical protein
MNEISRKLKIIERILWEDWDPIGINVIVTAKDEYDSYAPKVYKLLQEGKSAEEVAEYLSYVDGELIGNTPNESRNLEVAKKLIQIFAD